MSCLQGSLLKCFLLCVRGFAAANLLRWGVGRRRLPSSPVKPCCVCVCVCVWSRRVCGVCGGQISPSGGQDGASCGRGATRSAPVGEHLRQGSRLGLAARQTGRGGKGAASFVKVAVASCRATKAAASAAGIAEASSCQHMRGWTVAGEDLVMRSVRVPQLARRPSDEICLRATPGQDRAGDLQRVRLTS